MQPKAAAKTRKKTMKTGWSAAEDDALLRAWADVTSRSAKSLSKAFAATCAAAAVSQERTTVSLSQRRAQYVRMYEIVLAFHKSRQPTSADGVVLQSNEGKVSAEEYSSDSWFELRRKEQRRWYASLNTGTSTFGEMTQETFKRVDAILKRQGYASAVRRVALYTLPREMKLCVEDSLPTTESGVNHRSDKGVSMVQDWAAGTPSGSFKCESSHVMSVGEPAVDGEDDSSSGSSTESDDEALTWWGEDDEATSQRPVKEKSDLKIQMLSSDPDFNNQHSHLAGSVDPDFLELVGALETQSRHLSALFRQTKRRRFDESRGRKYTVKTTRLEDNNRARVHQDIAQREQELQRKREQWDEERRSIKREMVRLRGRRAGIKPQAASASSSSVSLAQQ